MLPDAAVRRGDAREEHELHRCILVAAGSGHEAYRRVSLTWSMVATTFSLQRSPTL